MGLNGRGRRKTSPQKAKEINDRQRPRLNRVDEDLTSQAGSIASHASALAALESFRNRPAKFAPEVVGRSNIGTNAVGRVETQMTGSGGLNLSASDISGVRPASVSDDIYLKSNKHPGFGSGHGNAHHNPNFAAAGHSHSISFKDLPQAHRAAIVSNMAYMRSLYQSALISPGQEYTPEQVRDRLGALGTAVMHLYHMVANEPNMTAQEIHSRLVANPSFKLEKWNQQGVDQDPDSKFFIGAPEEFGGDPASQVFFVSSRSGVTDAGAARTVDSPLALQDDVMVANVASTSEAFAPSGWTEALKSVSGSLHLATFYRVRGSSEPGTYTFSLASGITGRILVDISAYARVDTQSPVADSGANTAFDAAQLLAEMPAGGPLIAAFAVSDAQDYELSFSGLEMYHETGQIGRGELSSSDSGGPFVTLTRADRQDLDPPHPGHVKARFSRAIDPLGSARAIAHTIALNPAN